MAAQLKAADLPPRGTIEDIDAATIRFAGDVGDGVQAIAAQFAAASTAHGNAVFTLPDPPAEIRAPAGSLASVSSVQVRIARHALHTPGDVLDALVAMNPSALMANLADLAQGGILILNANAFTPHDLELAGYHANPLEDGSLAGYRLLAVPMTDLNREVLGRANLSPRETERCKNFFALGVACWLYQRRLEPIIQWIRDTYAKNPAMIEANTRTLKAGFHYHDVSDDLPTCYRVAKADIPAGRYRNVSGIDALALGVLTAARQAQLPLVFASFPAAPSAELLHRLCEWKQPGAKVIQSEDDLASINLAIGAAFGGALAVTATSGSGLALQSESLGLAVMAELPLVVIDVQRAGPGAGMPNKAEQADLLQAIHGRNGESPLIVLAMATPADGFAIMLEAARLAIRCMSPVIVLSDAYLAQAAEVWQVPAVDTLPSINVPGPHMPANGQAFLPYQRDENLARPWAIPGTPGLEHRIGGLEKEAGTGNVSFDPANHAAMVRVRAEKIAKAADAIAPLEPYGAKDANVLVVGWGSTYGVLRTAVERCQGMGHKVAGVHFRHLFPMPPNTAAVLKSYQWVFVFEQNSSQLWQLLRTQAGFDEITNKCAQHPLSVNDVVAAIQECAPAKVEA